jgi:hypothetical protein
MKSIGEKCIHANATNATNAIASKIDSTITVVFPPERLLVVAA